MAKSVANERLDAIKKTLERAMIDLKIARGGDHSYNRLTLLRETLHDASMAMFDLMEELDVYGLKAAARRARETTQKQLPMTIVTTAPKRRELPAPGESIFD